MSLKQEITAHIRAQGPMRLSDYMARCNSHYYATRDPFGESGDFITAPEISQVFGELIGLWAADLWQRAGSPATLHLVELGPGRGTLMADALRATLNVPGFHGAMHVHFIETSPVLRNAQMQRVRQAHWHDSWDGYSQQRTGGTATIIIANEFLDALPVRQFRWSGSAWQEVHVALGIDDGFVYTVRDKCDRPPPGPDGMKAGDLADHGHEAAAFIRQLDRAAESPAGLAALIIDYGFGKRAMGTTLQALHRHHFADVLANPGEQDLTAHVDFGDLAQQCNLARVHGPVSQGAFLRALGLDMRTAQLARGNPERAPSLAAASARLAEPDQMGSLFKAMCLTSPHWPTPAGFA
jgi:NADH dehydrogenase [ubiquinone] 1 alpha subcomplex assembly factor 7